MNEISSISIIVISANTLTAIVSTTLLMLVFWQNPYHRQNQFFAASMLALTGLSLMNSLGRLIDVLDLKPETVFYTVNTFYSLFVLSLLNFSMFIATEKAQRVWRLNIIFGVVSIVGILLMWTGYSDAGITSQGNGNYQTNFNVLGYFTSIFLFLGLIISAWLLYQYRRHTPRSQYLWTAPILVIFGLIWALVFWAILQIPITALSLAGAAFILGRVVLLEQTFDPVARYSAELTVKNRELTETNRIKSQFMANISHELRTPLNNIIGYTDLLTTEVYGPISPQQTDRLEKVGRNARHLLGLINDILDLSHIEAGGLALSPETIGTGELLRDVLALMNAQITEKRLEVVAEFENVPAIYADKMRTRQILLNILSNAVKFTAEGAVSIFAKAGPDDMVLFEIADTGIGIPAEKQHVVFEEFRQVDNTSTRQYGGTGLGMSITKRLVELSGGKIWFESEVGVGTQFFFTLPQATVSTQPEVAIASPSKNLVHLPEQKKVLIIDDSLDSQILLRDVFQRERPNFRVIVANSGQEGLERARETHPNLITLDVMMPGIDGWEVLKALRADPDLSQVPVVLISIIDNHSLAAKMGANAILEKPIDINSVLETVDRLLETSQFQVR